ncbi:MAG TPA: cytochrome P450 [Solirubrobacteraceae bacterium]|jgi:cytochrome P450
MSITAADLRDLAPDAVRDPHPLFAAWRAAGPVVAVPELGGWAVTDFALAAAVLRDPETWSSDRFDGPAPAEVAAWTADLIREEPSLAELLAVPLQTLVALDPPDHGRLRKVLVPYFAAASIRRLEPLVAAQVAALVASLPGGGEPFDFVAAFAEPLPFRVVALLFGLPEAEWPRFAALAAAANGDAPHLETKARLRERLLAELALMRYFARRIEAPGTDPEGLLAGLGAAVAAGAITLREATGLCREVLVAGADSTGNHLSTAVLALARDPALAARLRDDPALVEPFAEELLRLEPPFKGFWRRARRDAVLGGVRIPGDGLVLLPFAALNRDPAAVDRPDAIVLDRPSPRRHLSFGHGIHFCIGAPLARLQSAVALRALLARGPELTLAEPVAGLRYRPSIQVGGLAALRVALR